MSKVETTQMEFTQFLKTSKVEHNVAPFLHSSSSKIEPLRRKTQLAKFTQKEPQIYNIREEIINRVPSNKPSFFTSVTKRNPLSETQISSLQVSERPPPQKNPTNQINQPRGENRTEINSCLDKDIRSTPPELWPFKIENFCSDKETTTKGIKLRRTRAEDSKLRPHMGT